MKLHHAKALDVQPSDQLGDKSASPCLPIRPDRSRREIGTPRPIGVKAAALLARRQRIELVKSVGPPGPQAHPKGLRLASEDGSLVFLLKATRAGLCVERTQHRAAHAAFVQCAVFASDAAFHRWCVEDPVRFVHPVLYLYLRSEGHDLLPT